MTPTMPKRFKTALPILLLALAPLLAGCPEIEIVEEGQQQEEESNFQRGLDNLREMVRAVQEVQRKERELRENGEPPAGEGTRSSREERPPNPLEEERRQREAAE